MRLTLGKSGARRGKDADSVSVALSCAEPVSASAEDAL
jgi:hypothetical protein